MCPFGVQLPSLSLGQFKFGLFVLVGLEMVVRIRVSPQLSCFVMRMCSRRELLYALVTANQCFYSIHLISTVRCSKLIKSGFHKVIEISLTLHLLES